MKAITMVLCLFLFSCELHEQQASFSSADAKQVFGLSEVSELFKYIGNGDYFALKQALEENQELANAKNDQGQVLIVTAIEGKKLLMTNLLLNFGADLELRNQANINAIEAASKLSDSEMWLNILEQGSVPQEMLNDNLLEVVSEAAEDTQSNAIATIDVLVSSGAELTVVNQRKYTLLMIASSRGLTELVDYLCQQDEIDINLKPGRFTALGLTQKLARRNPKLKKVIEVLLSYGAKS